jgi:hypothetical protein
LVGGSSAGDATVEVRAPYAEMMAFDHENRRRAIVEAFRESRLSVVEQRVEDRFRRIEERADALAVKVDRLAEGLRRIGATTLGPPDDVDVESFPS